MNTAAASMFDASTLIALLIQAEAKKVSLKPANVVDREKLLHRFCP